MDQQSIHIGGEYGYRDYPRKKGSAMFRIEVLDKARSGQWQVRFLDGPHAGVKDYVKSAHIIVPWGESVGFLEDERRLEELLVVSREQHNKAGEVVSDAVQSILESTGEGGVWVDGDGHSGMPLDAARRILMRTHLDWDPLHLDALSFIDRHGEVHLPFEAVQKLAQAFAAAEPDTVQLSIASQEFRLDHEARMEMDSDYLVEFLQKSRASWKVALRWSEAGPKHSPDGISIGELRQRVDDTIATVWRKVGEIDESRRSEIQRLRLLIEQAAEDLRELGAPDKAEELIEALAGNETG